MIVAVVPEGAGSGEESRIDAIATAFRTYGETLFLRYISHKILFWVNSGCLCTRCSNRNFFEENPPE